MRTSLLFLICVGLSFVSFSQEYTPLKSTRHYVYSLNTGDNLTLGIPDFAWDEKPQTGDEVGVFNANGQLVGSGVYDNGHMAIAVWGDDETTKEKEGVSNGEKFSLRLWRATSGEEELIQVIGWLDGDDVFHSNGIAVVNKIGLIPPSELKSEYSLGSCMPNPVKDMARISYSLPESALVDISLFTTTGEFVKQLVAGEKSAGSYSFDFQRGELASGNYYYRMTTSGYSSTRYLTIAK